MSVPNQEEFTAIPALARVNTERVREAVTRLSEPSKGSAMDELRVTRREENALILANELGEEFRLIVDEVAQSEFRQLSRRSASGVTVRPREIQALLRAGKSRAEVAEEAGVDESDVARFEEPVRAEQRYILEIAHAVTVRTDPELDTGENNSEQRFGEVIAERLIGLGSSEHIWRSWKDETTGWHIGLEFMTRDEVHDAIWGFDHRKHVLTPISPDATHLSKLGAVGDQLIPKLRAVGGDSVAAPVASDDQFSAPGFDTGSQSEAEETASSHTNANGSSHATTEANTDAADAGAGVDAATQPSADDEYERRREIDQRAINKPDDTADDLSQTADLLDALRRRRGERANQLDLAIEGDSIDSSFTDAVLGDRPAPKNRPGAATNIWGASGVSADESDQGPEVSGLRAVPSAPESADDGSGAGSGAMLGKAENEADETTQEETSAPNGNSNGQDSARGAKSSRRGRSSIPSWDDILFGTRSEDDPA